MLKPLRPSPSPSPSPSPHPSPTLTLALALTLSLPPSLTITSGGELVLEQLRANARAISCITLWLSLASLGLVFPVTLFVLVRFEPLGPGPLSLKVGNGHAQPSPWPAPYLEPYYP